MSPESVDELVLADADGVWAIRSESPTVYYVDADFGQLLRQTQPGAYLGLADNRWVPLVAVDSLLHGDSGVIRVGDRHRYTYDHDVDGDEFGWILQRRVTAIEFVEGPELAALPGPPSGGVS